ncbi:Hypothetical protein Tpal_261 [Trichococcus palustris]|uniref:Uncharacterized protein n=1 Tax=Trichococcus palustris TaxID=140314 RepID=A0A143Y557_9LACT|nr:Hypothetical protein Tpal_261 [Trichococcus palustris]
MFPGLFFCLKIFLLKEFVFASDKSFWSKGLRLYFEYE